MSKRSLITAHIGADFDAFGSMLAASKTYPDSYLVWPGSIDERLQAYVKERSASIDGFVFNLDDATDWKNIKLLVSVDTRKLARLKHIDPLLVHFGLKSADHVESKDHDDDHQSKKKHHTSNKSIEVHAYDHHPPTSDDISADKLVYKEWGSASSIMTHEIMHYNQSEKGKKEPIQISGDEAASIALGIYQDTGNFTYNCTTKEDLEAAVYLRSIPDMKMEVIADYLHISTSQSDYEKDPEALKVMNNLSTSAKSHNIRGTEVVIAEASSEDYLSNFSGISQRFMERENIENLFCIGQFVDRIVLVGRSKSKNHLDVGSICKSFGGGGHYCAASATVKDVTLAQMKDELFAHIYSSIEPVRRVSDIMTSPPIVIESDKSVSDAAELFNETGIKKMLVLSTKDQHCVGCIDKNTIEKAIARGENSKKVTEYTDRTLVSLPEGSLLDQAIVTILRKRQRVIPIVSDKNPKEIVGVVSKTDIIDILINDEARFPTPLLKKNQRNLLPELKKNVNIDVVNFLEKLGIFMNNHQTTAYVVGGFVRNLLLDHSNFDVDIIIEGAEDMSSLVREFVDQNEEIVSLTSENSSHEFQTCVLKLAKNGMKVYLSAAKMEYYPVEVGLSTIELSTLKIDLSRRDFTMNALAMQLNPSKSFGLLVDYFHGEHDIENRLIQVIHSLSFVEDPSRILRAIRFEQRLGFKIAKQTEKLIRSAVASKVINKALGTAKFMEEFLAILQGPKNLESLRRMKTFQILQAIHPAFPFQVQ